MGVQEQQESEPRDFKSLENSYRRTVSKATILLLATVKLTKTLLLILNSIVVLMTMIIRLSVRDGILLSAITFRSGISIWICSYQIVPGITTRLPLFQLPGFPPSTSRRKVPRTDSSTPRVDLNTVQWRKSHKRTVTHSLHSYWCVERFKLHGITGVHLLHLFS